MTKLKDCINFDIYRKNLLLHSQPPPWFCDLACLWSWLTGLGFGLDTSGLVNIPGIHHEQTDRRTPDRYIMLTARHNQRNNALCVNALINPWPHECTKKITNTICIFNIHRFITKSHEINFKIQKYMGKNSRGVGFPKK